jgi:hypothetical protein
MHIMIINQNQLIRTVHFLVTTIFYWVRVVQHKCVASSSRLTEKYFCELAEFVTVTKFGWNLFKQLDNRILFFKISQIYSNVGESSHFVVKIVN